MGPARYEYIVHCLILLLGHLLQGFSTNVPARDVLDLIQALNATEENGFQFTSGPNNNTLALVLEDPNRHVALPETVLQESLRILREHDEITFLASVKQEVGDSGSIISFSSDLYRFLEIESSGRKDEIRFHYTHDQQIHVETFPYRLSDGQWHLLALSLSGTQLTLLVDCSQIYQRLIQSVDRVFSSGKLTLFLGQRNGQHALFRGALQDVKIVTQSHGYLLQCPEQDSDCPTCAQYQAMEQKIQEMYDLYQNISKKLLQAEERISSLEECECLRSCSDNGTVRKEGEEWQRDKCTVCRCMNGSIECQSVECAPVDCQRPVYRDGECCPVCLTNCYYSGKYYDHGEQFSPRVCVECTCSNGKMVCKRQDQTCPELNCPESERIQIQGECCPVCKGTDFCALGHDCHVNATCINLSTKYACQCDPGFHGDGTFCEDVNECVQEGGRQGHHCHRNTVCVNTLGSYKCVCQSGHSRLDDYTCEELDECESGSHQCHPNADCLNVPGSYLCQCQPGYSGDGRNCQPICHGGCLNGGRCIAHNVCECRHGYIGPNCELDIDECALGISACRGHSVCVNAAGSYHCDCLQGFHSSWPQNHFGTLCLDVNECLGEGEGHTCHPSARCVNTEGGYQCRCPEHSPGCSHSCVFEGSEHSNSSSWFSAMDKCMRCTCRDGVTSCHKRECDCEADDVDLDCCAHCDVSSQCPHQELPTVMANGQHWVFQCQTCECLKGEIDCWPMECPPLSCAEQVQQPGQCCPHCVEDNPCQSPGLTLGGADLSALTCLYLGHTFRDGDAWVLEADPCTSCECMAGHICCSFNQTCSSNLNWR